MADSQASMLPSDVLVERLRAALADDAKVAVAYLFGSQARGVAGPMSDVDVAVLLDGVEDVESHQLELSATLADVVAPRQIDIVVLNEAPVALGYRVLRDGRLLISRDDVARVRYWTSTVDRYLDMEPARRMMAAGLEHRLAEGRFGRP